MIATIGSVLAVLVTMAASYIPMGFFLGTGFRFSGTVWDNTSQKYALWQAKRIVKKEGISVTA